MTTPTNPPIQKRVRPAPFPKSDLDQVIERGRPQARTTPKLQSEIKAIKSTAELVAHLNIPADWDYILVGDGSATQWDSGLGGGWACCLIAKDGYTKWFYGSSDVATNYTAEMMAYVTPLVWLSAHRTDLGPRRVHIVTDADYVAKAGSKRFHTKHKELWQLFHAFERCGFILTWHWIPRNCLGFNKMADNLAGKVRKATIAFADKLQKLHERYIEKPAAAPAPETEPEVTEL